MQRIRLDLAYDGTTFGGWQRQKQTDKPSPPTIQESLERAVSRLFNTRIRVVGSGRTDAGVHALRQVAHFDCDYGNFNSDLVYKINCLTPIDLAVKRAYLAPPDFHAQRSAISKTYRYVILNSHRPSPFRHRFSHWVRLPLDLDFLNECSLAIIGEHDFLSFKTRGTELKSTVRRIERAQWQRKGHLLIFTIQGSGFLKQMVRNIVGTLIDLNLRGLPSSHFSEILRALDRKSALTTAPPQGLFLTQVKYPEELDSKCVKL